MMKKLIERFTQGFELTQYLVDDERGWFLQTTCSYDGAVIYVNRLDLLPLYESMQRRDQE